MEKLPENVKTLLDEVGNNIENAVNDLVMSINRVEHKLSEKSIDNVRIAMSSYIAQYNIVQYLKNENENLPYCSDMFKYFDAFIYALILSIHYSKEDLYDLIIYFLKKSRNIDTIHKYNDLPYVIYCCFHEIFDIRKREFVCDIRKAMNGDFQYVTDWLYNHMHIVAKKTSSIIVDYQMMNEPLNEILSLVDKEPKTLEDVIAVANIMSDLDFSHEVGDLVKKSLLKEYRREHKKNEEEIKLKDKKVIVKKEIKKQTNVITDKEYRSILKEIRKYFNPYTVQLTVEEISEEERNYVFSLMVKIGLNQNTIARFMHLTEKEEKHTYEYFKDHIDEFSYYYQDYMETLLDYYNELKNCLDEEKEFWINAINDALGKIKYDGKLDSYEYEIRKLKGSN